MRLPLFTRDTPFCLCLILATLLLPLPAWSAPPSELDPALQRIKELVQEQNYTKALQEVNWVREQIERQQGERLKSFFPDKLGSYQSGDFTLKNGVGGREVGRKYRTEDGSSELEVTLRSGGALNIPGLGGLSALAPLAVEASKDAAVPPALQGALLKAREKLAKKGQSISKVTAHNLSGLLTQSSPEKAELTLLLNSGSIITIKTRGPEAAAAAQSSMEAFPIPPLDQYLLPSKKE